ncbi:unnamed protein product [Candida verbasci]|uniref:Uncharacterized protein n=1 Tax=Candida verbasci TaxID=1227364 RepID=A0A9W4TV74_9ASCO|nr:unnamed protein product [Candida verbasci]
MSEIKIKKDPTGFSKSIIKKYDDNTEFFFHKLEFLDKIILNIAINGVQDTTFEIPMTTKTTINYMSAIEQDFEDQSPEPRLIIGNHDNLKIHIVASQIGKLILQSNPKDLIISIGSKWFGKGDDIESDDFDKLMFVLANVKTLLQ